MLLEVAVSHLTKAYRRPADENLLINPLRGNFDVLDTTLWKRNKFRFFYKQPHFLIEPRVAINFPKMRLSFHEAAMLSRLQVA